MAKPRKPKPLYNVERIPHLPYTYKVQKMDHELNHLEVPYNVFFPPTAGHGSRKCDCFAGLMGKQCRHIQMVELFIAENKVGTTALYCYDHKEWHQ